jgi:hypothetical protein
MPHKLGCRIGDAPTTASVKKKVDGISDVAMRPSFIHCLYDVPGVSITTPIAYMLLTHSHRNISERRKFGR